MIVVELWLLCDLTRFKTTAQARRALRASKRACAGRVTLAWLLSVAVVIGPFVFLILGDRTRAWLLSLSPYAYILMVALPGALLGGCLLVLGFWLLRRPMRLSLRRQLNTQGIPTCLHCGYDMTGNTSDLCPECGTEFKEEHQSSELADTAINEAHRISTPRKPILPSRMQWFNLIVGMLLIVLAVHRLLFEALELFPSIVNVGLVPLGLLQIALFAVPRLRQRRVSRKRDH